MSIPVPTSALAFLTTVHVAMAVLLWHRRRSMTTVALLLLPASALSVSPWLLPTPMWLAVGFAAHVAYFVASEKLIAPTSPRTKTLTAPVPQPLTARPAAPAPAPVAATPQPAPALREFTTVPVLAVLRETPEISTFRVERPEGVTFQAGQFLMVKLTIDGKPAVRCYSISSSPETTGYFEISVRRAGLVSSALHATLRPGSRLSVKGPGGHFIYPGDDERPIVLLAAGVGITPLMSMLRHAVAADPGRRITLLYSARTEADVAFGPELELLVNRHPNVSIGVTLSAKGAPGRFQGRIDAGLIQRFVPDPRGAIFLICGPGPMIATMRELLSSLGVPGPQIRFEAFEAAVQAASGATAPAAVAPAHVPAPATPAQRAAPAARPAPAADAITVKFSVSKRSVPGRPDQSLLEAAEDAGVEIPSLCRAGACGTCKTRVVEGNVACDADSLDPDEARAGYILACVAHPRGSCTVEA